MKPGWKVMLLMILVSSFTSAQQRTYKFAVFFEGKDTLTHRLSSPHTFLSDKSIVRKKSRNAALDFTDLPVSESYVQSLREAGFYVHNTSRWFNCAIVFTERKNMGDSLLLCNGVSKVEEIGYSLNRKHNTQRYLLSELLAAIPDSLKETKGKQVGADPYGASRLQAAMLGIDRLHAEKMTGQGVTIAVIDAGFSNAHTHPSLIRNRANVKAAYDIVDQEENVFNDDDHGTAVWSCLAALDSFNFIGTAPGAEYILLRSEDAATEFPVEEYYWTIAAEYADSAGADIISTSLGYNIFGDDRYSYRQKQLDGKTAMISKAAAMASGKGMLVICSAGNEGDNDWKQIVFPADVKDVIAIGAVNKQGKLAGFSSIGLTADKRIKPDLMAMGEGTFVADNQGSTYEGNGTSYACPVFAGGVACLWPVLKQLSNEDIRKLILLSADNYNHPDRYFGSGVPDLHLVMAYVRSYEKTTLLDVRMLSDRSVHLAMYASEKQKLKVSFRDESGKEVINQVLPVDAGNLRIRLDDSEKLKAGRYQMHISDGKSVNINRLLELTSNGLYLY